MSNQQEIGAVKPENPKFSPLRKKTGFRQAARLILQDDIDNMAALRRVIGIQKKTLIAVVHQQAALQISELRANNLEICRFLCEHPNQQAALKFRAGLLYELFRALLIGLHFPIQPCQKVVFGLRDGGTAAGLCVGGRVRNFLTGEDIGISRDRHNHIMYRTVGVKCQNEGNQQAEEQKEQEERKDRLEIAQQGIIDLSGFAQHEVPSGI